MLSKLQASYAAWLNSRSRLVMCFEFVLALPQIVYPDSDAGGLCRLYHVKSGLQLWLVARLPCPITD